mmetsp:Transcript_26413/g.54830  ORF Transcript_26413/g.54830 Transcript_26413/m.54830 type:complete len:227 (-) Transcript_26413:219-899(-)
MAWATNSSAALSTSPWSRSWRFTRFTACCMFMTLSSPSLASMRNSSDGRRSNSITSGLATTTLLLCRRLPLSLKLALKPTSPKARDVSRMPWMRPLDATIPPAAWIRAASSGIVGLWGVHTASAVPARHRMAAESPTCAMSNRAALALRDGVTRSCGRPPSVTECLMEGADRTTSSGRSGGGATGDKWVSMWGMRPSGVGAASPGLPPSVNSRRDVMRACPALDEG